MEIVRSESYEELAASYQCLEIEALSRVLVAHGILDVDVRRRICADYVAATAALLDRGWIKVQGQVVHPFVGFMKGSDPSGAVCSPEVVALPSEGFAFEEYVSGNIFHYFDESKESLNDLPRGHL